MFVQVFIGCSSWHSFPVPDYPVNWCKGFASPAFSFTTIAQCMLADSPMCFLMLQGDANPPLSEITSRVDKGHDLSSSVLLCASPELNFCAVATQAELSMHSPNFVHRITPLTSELVLWTSIHFLPFIYTTTTISPLFRALHRVPNSFAHARDFQKVQHEMNYS